jgi:hypothetical protein
LLKRVQLTLLALLLSVSPTLAQNQQSGGKRSVSKESQEPLTVGGKFRYFANESFRPGVFLVAGFYTGLAMANPPKGYPREWRQGAAGFGRNYGDFIASWTAVQGGKFIAASALHDDPRYVRSTSRKFFARAFHAVRFAVIDKSDTGRNRPALSNVAGAFAGGFVGNAYLPDGYNDVTHGLQRSALAFTGFATSNLVDEFRPEIRKIGHKLKVPFIDKF